jgi:hypothetical protein
VEEDEGMIVLKKTCSSCPEQYEAFHQDVQVGYLRLRWGTFRVWVPDHTGNCIYEACPDGDGMFEPEERQQYLQNAVNAIIKDAGLERQPFEVRDEEGKVLDHLTEEGLWGE